MDVSVGLRALSQADAALTAQWRNDPAVRSYYAAFPFYVNEEKETAWFQKALMQDFPSVYFGIELLPSGQLIGMSSLRDMSFVHRHAGFGIMIGEPAMRGKGYGKAATLLTLEFAFGQLNLHRLYLRVQERHQRAIQLYRSCGFVQEGLLRESVYKDGAYRDEVLMGLLKRDFVRPA
ncbi:MAG: N-acetyltransferase [Bacteroidetes bacterium]|nr:MAG: N-acetyltransferase [Bacteroidota bacterium]